MTTDITDKIVKPLVASVWLVHGLYKPIFDGCTPILAAAFHVKDIDYRWERGVRHALTTSAPEMAS